MKAVYHIIDEQQKIIVKVASDKAGESNVSFTNAFTKIKITCSGMEIITFFELKKPLAHNLKTLLFNRPRFIQFYDSYVDTCLKFNISKSDDFSLVQALPQQADETDEFFKMDLISLFYQIPVTLSGQLARSIRHRAALTH